MALVLRLPFPLAKLAPVRITPPPRLIDGRLGHSGLGVAPSCYQQAPLNRPGDLPRRSGDRIAAKLVLVGPDLKLQR